MVVLLEACGLQKVNLQYQELLQEKIEVWLEVFYIQEQKVALAALSHSKKGIDVHWAQSELPTEGINQQEKAPEAVAPPHRFQHLDVSLGDSYLNLTEVSSKLACLKGQTLILGLGMVALHKLSGTAAADL
jgi:hypothetical protein